MTEKTLSLSLKNLLVPSKDSVIEFPGLPGFKVSLKYLTRDALIKLREKATSQKFKAGRAAEEEVNQDLFVQLYADAAITNWEGLKLKYLLELAPVDLGTVDQEDFLAYTQENALFLMRNSSAFDSWVSNTVSDLANFQSNSASK